MATPREAILSLGSNLGDRRIALERACAALAEEPGLRILERSPIYETEPVGVPEEEAGRLFLNQVVIVSTDRSPEALSDTVHAIEARWGRTRTGVHGAARVLDIDLIAFGTERRNTPELTLPHPRTRKRRFVLQPLADLRPNLVLPGESRSVAELLRDLPDTPRVRRIQQA